MLDNFFKLENIRFKLLYVDPEIDALVIFKYGKIIYGSFLLGANYDVEWGKTLIEFPFSASFEVRFGTAGDNIYCMICDKYLKVYRSKNYPSKYNNYFNFLFIIKD